ncbi:MAG: hypothetical protein EOP83_01295 [Verrucomicrobiaceae bacterium]|nr:MAG: hypothetical protein EOP83_01295 [Verrucomicrobiaceae bacterium]
MHAQYPTAFKARACRSSSDEMHNAHNIGQIADVVGSISGPDRIRSRPQASTGFAYYDKPRG